jgi:hypothetical protein
LKRFITFITLFCLLFSVPVAASDGGLGVLLNRYATKRDLTDWEAMVLGLNSVPIKTPLFATPYFRRLENEIKNRKGEYRLVTDYARIVLVYSSHGKDPANIAGYDFIERIINFPNIQNQGLNAFAWALIALYSQPDAVTRPLIDNILLYQAETGGFTLSQGGNPRLRREDVDLTAMALTALAPYRDCDAVSEAIEGAMAFLSRVQDVNGGYISYGVNNPESASQVIIALCSLWISLEDPRFVKNGATVMDALLSFQQRDGSFAREANALKTDPISTRQAALALTAVKKRAEAAVCDESPVPFTEGWLFGK